MTGSIYQLRQDLLSNDIFNNIEWSYVDQFTITKIITLMVDWPRKLELSSQPSGCETNNNCNLLIRIFPALEAVCLFSLWVLFG